MNQTRVFLIFAWLMVATLLWMEWGKFNAPKPAPAATPSTQVATPSSSSPSGTVPSATAAVEVPAAGTVVPATATAAAATATSPRVVVSNDVLRLTLDGGSVLEADLLQYPRDRTSNSRPVSLFSQDPAHFYAAQSGW